MQVARLTIEHFRAVRSATMLFQGHSLLVGANNIGKSTVCEALDLVLGPDRLSRFPPVEEFDFYNAEYLAPDGKPLPARVEVVVVDLSQEIELACRTHLEFWHKAERRVLEQGEVDTAVPPLVVPCLRLESVASYNPEEDEFEADTFFAHGTSRYDGAPEKVGKRIKRMFGFLYLRTLRTGSRALSLERGSLLDLILRLQGVRTGLWERAIRRLRDLDPPIGNDAAGLASVLDNIENRLAEYIPLMAPGNATKLFVSQLTREHLRKTISFFLSTNADQTPVPFHESGTGTLNTVVLALLSFIAEMKPQNVIFAMEEPEIALPPHTQRRIANYLLTKTTQCFVTSHSPYVIERFGPDQIQILRRDDTGALSATVVASASTLKEKHYRRHARRGLAEAMLGRAVIVAEGVTEHAALSAVAEKMEEADANRWPLDLAGVTIFPVDGDGDMPVFGAFFKALGLQAYAFYDKKIRKAEEATKFAASFDTPCETPYEGIEKLLVAEIPADRQWQFLEALRDSGRQGKLSIPAQRPSPEHLATLMYDGLKSNKGNGYAAGLIDLCESAELPNTMTDFLTHIYSAFPKPVPPPTSAPCAKGTETATPLPLAEGEPAA